MEDAFNKLQKDNKNSVDNLVKWMKDSNIVDGVKVTEDNVRKCFEGVADVTNVELAKFNEVLAKLATEQKKNVDEFMNTLAAEGPKLLNAMTVAANAFKDALSKK